MEDDRGKYLDELREFVESSSNALTKFMERMGWSSNKFTTTSVLSSCHQEVTQNSSNNEWTTEKNEYSEEPLLPSTPLPQAIHKYTVTIDEAKQREILAPHRRGCGADVRRTPTTAGELTANFSREERLALYQYTLLNTQAPALPPQIQHHVEASDSQPRELSQEELNKALRDSKRRRQAYRTKVSTKNKSQTQVTREIIANMMELLGGADDHCTPIHPTATPGHPTVTPGDHVDPLTTQQGPTHHSSALLKDSNSNEKPRKKEQQQSPTPQNLTRDRHKDDRHSAKTSTARDTKYENPKDSSQTYKSGLKQERHHKEKDRRMKEKHRERKDDYEGKRKRRKSTERDSQCRGDRSSSQGAGANGHKGEDGKRRKRRRNNSMVREDGEITSDSDGYKSNCR